MFLFVNLALSLYALAYGKKHLYAICVLLWMLYGILAFIG